MRAAQFHHYGDADVLQVVEVTDPTPTAAQVLVRVAATSVNPSDTYTRQGSLRLLSGRRFPQGTGMDVAGIVEAVGSGVTNFVPGDRGWGIKAGFFPRTTGAAAELMVVDARLLAIIPEHLGTVEAAALPAVGITAITAVRDRGRVSPGDRVLVTGGAGGVGSAVIQYSHYRGAHVSTLVSGRNLDFVRALGADVALDRHSNFLNDLGEFDVIIDTVGTDLNRLRQHLSARGRMVTIAFSSIGSIITIALSVIHGRKRIRAFAGQPPHGMIEQLGEVVSAGGLKPVIERIYPLESITEAHRDLEDGGTRGKRVIAINAVEGQ